MGEAAGSEALGAGFVDEAVDGGAGAAETAGDVGDGDGASAGAVDEAVLAGGEGVVFGEECACRVGAIMPLNQKGDGLGGAMGAGGDAQGGLMEGEAGPASPAAGLGEDAIAFGAWDAPSAGREFGAVASGGDEPIEGVAEDDGLGFSA